MRTNLTHLARNLAPSATINTFSLFVLLSREMRPQRSWLGLTIKDSPNAQSISIHTKRAQIGLKESATDTHFPVLGRG